MNSRTARFWEDHKAPLQFTAYTEFSTISEHILECFPAEIKQLTAILTNNYRMVAKL